MPNRAHLITGGYPVGSAAGHDMDYARIELLRRLYASGYQTTVANDFTDIGPRLAGVDFLVTYVAGPYPDDEQSRIVDDWLAEGGKWFALHGTSGGRAKRVDGSRRRKMVRLAHHDLLGAFFLNHPPVRRFDVAVEANDHPLVDGLPETFAVTDELYLIEPVGESRVLLTTELAKDPSPEGFGFVYDEDTSVGADGKTRVLGLERKVGDGAVAYVALGHCHSPTTNAQPFVDRNVDAEGKTPLRFRGAWETPEFGRILDNAMGWGQSAAA
ncbi:MAG: ThuA domain-containing protein [Gammaproteobacteria bacterium]|nr:ThuA domain-containing protein [Gammaproteobacteria bacterium]